MANFFLSQFLEDLRHLRGQISSEIKSAQDDTASFVSDYLPNVTALRDGTIQLSFEDLRATREKRRADVLDQLTSFVGRRKSHRRLSSALDTFHRNRAELLRNLPQQWVGEGAAFLALLPDDKALAKKARWSKAKSLTIRDSAEYHFARNEQSLFIVEDRLLTHQVKSFHLLIKSWESLVGGSLTDDQIVEIEKDLKRLEQAGRDELSRWERVVEDEATRLGVAALQAPKKHVGVREKHQLFRSGYLRSLEADLGLQQSFEKTWDSTVSNLQLFQDQLLKELTLLRGERDEVIAYLKSRSGDGCKSTEFPPHSVKITPARIRCEELISRLTNSSYSLSESVEFLNLSYLQRGPRYKWDKLKPQAAFQRSFEVQAEQLLSETEEIVSVHLRLFREIERARDVVLFAAESSEQEYQSEVMLEAVTNATRLLELFDDERLNWSQASEPFWCRTLQLITAEYYERLGRDRAGLLKFLLSKGGSRGVRTAWQLGKKGLSVGATRASSWSEQASDGFLVRIGWKDAERSVTSTPERRAMLPKAYLQTDVRDMPAIYRRLFKVEPLEDSRFLVSRSEEMNILREARKLWSGGRSAAVILSGQRGSGKTSLLNCAKAEVFAEDRVAQIEPMERICTVEGLHSFLRTSLELPEDDKPLSEALLEFSGVVILEEVERLFLRKIGSYDAIFALLDLIATTQATCLWILSLNEVSLRLLERVAGFSNSFTHRIRASGVPYKSLKDAIYLRHNLSGLKLQFETPTSAWRTQAKLAKFQRWTEADSETHFFQMLSDRSSGVFRTALELWLGHIRLFEAGVLFMHPFHDVDSGPLLEELEQSDLFRLVAVLQHGSLTSKELATIFDCPEMLARTTLDELRGRDLIETEPLRPGYRVRPEALPVVKEALYRKNLL